MPQLPETGKASKHCPATNKLFNVYVTAVTEDPTASPQVFPVHCKLSMSYEYIYIHHEAEHKELAKEVNVKLIK